MYHITVYKEITANDEFEICKSTAHAKSVCNVHSQCELNRICFAFSRILYIFAFFPLQFSFNSSVFFCYFSDIVAFFNFSPENSNLERLIFKLKLHEAEEI